jgi:hypothetical protein
MGLRGGAHALNLLRLHSIQITRLALQRTTGMEVSNPAGNPVFTVLQLGLLQAEDGIARARVSQVFATWTI